MPSYVYLVAIVLLAVILVSVLYPLREKNKFKKRLQKEFGQVPHRPTGRVEAESFWQASLQHGPNPNDVDDLTWKDLNMDAVYYNLNACQSTVGDAWLYTVLRSPARQEPFVGVREELMDSFASAPGLRLEVQLALAGLGRKNGAGLEMPVYRAAQLGLPRRWLYRLLAFAPLLAVPLAFLNPGMAVMWLLVFCAGNLVFFHITKTANEKNFGPVRYLAAALACAQKLSGRLRASHPALAARLREACAVFHPYKAGNRILYIDHLFSESGLPNPFAFFLLPLLSFGKITGRLQQNGPDVLQLYALLGEVDAACAVLNFRHSLPNWCIPTYTDAPEICGEGVYHPLLDEAVGNPAQFNTGILLTGSNASGKSTYIKSVALCCLLGQAVNTCAATSFCLKRGAVSTSMAVEDDVVEGDSYFIAEIKSMRRLMRLAQTGTFCYFFIDEILKGTNTVERVAAAAAVLRYLQGKNCLCFAATHDIELTSILQGLYKNYHFRETVTPDGVVFDYKLHPGPSATRNAILLLSNMHFPKPVVEDARLLAQHFTQSGEWQAFGTV